MCVCVPRFGSGSVHVDPRPQESFFFSKRRGDSRVFLCGLEVLTWNVLESLDSQEKKWNPGKSCEYLQTSQIYLNHGENRNVETTKLTRTVPISGKFLALWPLPLRGLTSSTMSPPCFNSRCWRNPAKISAPLLSSPLVSEGSRDGHVQLGPLGFSEPLFYGEPPGKTCRVARRHPGGQRLQRLHLHSHTITYRCLDSKHHSVMCPIPPNMKSIHLSHHSCYCYYY